MNIINKAWKVSLLILCLTICSCELGNESKTTGPFVQIKESQNDNNQFDFLFEQISDLQKENRFRRMTFNQIQESFHVGVRYCEFDPFINIKTFFRFIISHKKTINEAIYKTETLNQKNVPFYQEPIKLLK